ncbi:RagB/SusD family nutrient uptake outer membrane protein [Parapedobacter sp. DT-150]|uniref:RagB/SusD family nutrient uptake outer membrane protein n=1 Tax=Parapedobacter sp. DT-150 TaxID=3396162 RepID=UPI003F1A4D7D
MKSFKLFIISLSTLMGVSCNNDFLERYPLDQVNDQNFWRSEQDLELFNNNFYATYIQGFGYDWQDGRVQPYDYNVATIVYGDVITDNAAPNAYSRVAANQYNGHISGGSGSGGWGWGNVRSLNYFLENYRRGDVPEDVQNLYAGEVHFFKAFEYFEKVKLFGDVPWISKVLQTDSPELLAPRTPRAEVIDSILVSLDKAIEWLPAKGAEKSGRINKDVAYHLKARVCLYEGTRRKYHPEMGLDGTELLRQCAASCEYLMGQGYALYSTGDTASDYNSLFAQYSYAGNPEVILWKEYSAALNLGAAFSRYYAQNLRHQHGATRSLVDEYLCIDGLPISSSPLYLGDDSIQVELQNRDPRLPQTICNFGEYALASHVSGSGNAPKPNIPGLSGNKCPTGYRVAKWFLDDPADWDRVTLGEQAAVVYRYAEVLLNYAEAKYELGEGTQDVIDRTINLIRARTGMPALDIANIAADPTLDQQYTQYCDYVPSPLLREIRRERRIEFAFENFRWDDLMRWKAGRFLEIPVEGITFVQEQFPAVRVGQDVFLSEDGRIMPYFQTLPDGRIFDDRQYLFPIPVEDLVLNTNLVQNPGWEQ